MRPDLTFDEFDSAGSPARHIESVIQQGEEIWTRQLGAARELPYEPPSFEGYLSPRVHPAAIPLALLLDVPHYLGRTLLSQLFAALGWLERRMYLRTVTCPYCFTPCDELLVCCPSCESIQGSLRHGSGELLYRRCCGEGRRRLRLLGQYRWSQGWPRVCRTTPRFFGCGRFFPSEILWGALPEVHLAVAGTTPWVKLSVLALLAKALRGPGSGWRGEPCWSQTWRECRYLDATLQADPTRLAEDARGRSYTLARTALFDIHRGEHQRLLHLHNVPARYCRTDETVFSEASHLVRDQGLILVLDPSRREPSMPAAQLYSRLLRVAERHGGDMPSSRPMRARVAVVLPHPRVLDPGEAEALVTQLDPHLSGLIRHTAGRSTRFFGGPPTFDGPREWVRELIDFVLPAPG
jgi:hypothetical protein